MSATPPLSAPSAPVLPAPWSVADLAGRLRSPALAVRLRDDDPGYGEQLDFDEPAPDAPAGRSATSPGEGLTPLVELGLLRVAGKEATTFLQGQLTNDVKEARLDQALLAGYCTAKGRLIASLQVWRAADVAADEVEAYWLACSRDLAANLARRLRMFVLRAKVRITGHDHDRLVLGLLGGRAVAAAADALVEHDAPSARQIVTLVEPGSADGDAAALAARAALPARALAIASLDELPVLARRAAEAGLRWVDTATWRWAEIQAGEPRIVAATSEAFVPQMVNLERIGGVSFTKGCYPGQEVVARSHYRATAKRRTVLVAGEGSLPVPGSDLDPSGGQSDPAGTVVLAARDPVDPGRWALLAEARLEAAAAGLASQGQPLAPRPLPYRLVDEA